MSGKRQAGRAGLLLLVAEGCGPAERSALIAPADLWLHGDASPNGAAVRLTREGPSAGAAWWGESGGPAPTRVLPPVGFEVVFELRFALLGDDGYRNPADGLAFVWLDLERADRYVGDRGGGLGYTEAPPEEARSADARPLGLSGWAVELDTFPNLDTPIGRAADGEGPHVALALDGDGWHPAQLEAAPLFRADLTGEHELMVRSELDHLHVTFDGETWLERRDWRPSGDHGLIGITSGAWSTPQLVVEILGGQFTDLRAQDPGEDE